MKEIVLQIRYMRGRPAWFVGSALGFAAMMQGIISEGIFHHVNLAYMMMMAMNFGIFIPLAPLACVLSVSGHLESSLQKACCYPHILRAGTRRFALSTAVSAAVAGGQALALGWGLSLLAAKVIGHMPLTGENMLGLEYTSLGGALVSGVPILYYAMRCVLVFLYGCFCVCFSLPVAFLRQEAMVICLAPFALLRILQLAFFDRLPVLLSPTKILLGMDIPGTTAPLSLALCVGSLVGMCAVFFLISVPVLERRLYID